MSYNIVLNIIHINMSYNIVLNIKLIPNVLFIMSWSSV